jgi:hypothetical protein
MTNYKLATEVTIYTPEGKKALWVTLLHETAEDKKAFEIELDKFSDIIDAHIMDIKAVNDSIDKKEKITW